MRIGVGNERIVFSSAAAAKKLACARGQAFLCHAYETEGELLR